MLWISHSFSLEPHNFSSTQLVSIMSFLFFRISFPYLSTWVSWKIIHLLFLCCHFILPSIFMPLGIIFITNIIFKICFQLICWHHLSKVFPQSFSQDIQDIYSRNIYLESTMLLTLIRNLKKNNTWQLQLKR